MKRLAAFLCALLLAFPAYAAGTLFGLPLSIQVDEDGDPLSGAKLYIYEANSSDPVTAYADFALTEGQELSFPIEADSTGRLPQFWLDDGSYRARLTTAEGVEVFDIASVTAIGASSGSGGGSGGGGGSADETAIFSTGDFLWQPISGTRSGWVRANGRTIGSASSGATERANADTGPLYEWLWNNFSDVDAPVSGGRGANAAADFAANKPIATIDMRGRMMLALDTMGNSAASVSAGVTTANAAGGDDASTALIAHTHTQQGAFTSGAGSAHSHGAGTFAVSTTVNVSNGSSIPANLSAGDFGTFSADAGSHDVFDAVSEDTVNIGAALNSGTVTGTSASESSHTHSTTISGATTSAGSGSSFSILNPYRAGTVYLKL